MTELDQPASKTSLTPLPDSKRARRALVAQRLALAENAPDPETAAAVLEESLRAGLWRYSELWSRLGELPQLKEIYPRAKRLWLDSPRACRTMRPAITAVARAAALNGEHREARLLMRKALVLSGAHRHRLTSRLRRAVGIAAQEGRTGPTELPTNDSAAAETSRYFELYEALMVADTGKSGVLIEQLRQQGEGEWLNRL